jgi:urease accessory protein
MTTTLNAALRCLRLTHYDTQRIIAELADTIEELYEQVHTLGVEQIYSFAPEVDLLAALHERGSARMFMN